MVRLLMEVDDDGNDADKDERDSTKWMTLSMELSFSRALLCNKRFFNKTFLILAC